LDRVAVGDPVDRLPAEADDLKSAAGLQRRAVRRGCEGKNRKG
jgi:hypothetical protein